MKFKLSGFAVVSDVLPCTDPWGEGMVFRMHRWGSKRHRNFTQERVQKDPLTVRALGKKVKRDIVAARTAMDEPAQEPKLVNGTAPKVEVVAVGEPIKHEEKAQPQDRDVFQECFLEAVEEALDKGDANVFDLIGLAGDDRTRDEVVALCDGWSGVNDDTGAEVPFSREALIDLLDADAIVKDGVPYAGETVGGALTKHLLEFAKGHSLTRDKYLEAGEKNSEGFSAGA